MMSPEAGETVRAIHPSPFLVTFTRVVATVPLEGTPAGEQGGYKGSSETANPITWNICTPVTITKPDGPEGEPPQEPTSNIKAQMITMRRAANVTLTSVSSSS